MKKYLFYFLVAFATVSFCACSDDDKEEDDDTNKPPVASITGAITKDGVAFGTKGLEVEEIIFTELLEQKTVARAGFEETPASMTLRFNDNVEIIVRSIGYDVDNTEAQKIYRLLKNCYKGVGDITINFIENGKVVSSETFDAPTDRDWWYMPTDDSYFTFDFDFKGEKYSYYGEIKYVFK